MPAARAAGVHATTRFACITAAGVAASTPCATTGQSRHHTTIVRTARTSSHLARSVVDAVRRIRDRRELDGPGRTGQEQLDATGTSEPAPARGLDGDLARPQMSVPPTQTFPTRRRHAQT